MVRYFPLVVLSVSGPVVAAVTRWTGLVMIVLLLAVGALVSRAWHGAIAALFCGATGFACAGALAAVEAPALGALHLLAVAALALALLSVAVVMSVRPEWRRRRPAVVTQAGISTSFVALEGLVAGHPYSPALFGFAALVCFYALVAVDADDLHA